ncbi:hypothetical protein F5Y15DRAFT_334700 [Xylariaceae sp. FL0016]|nr:hypothetical protein F5Y15DRAFT_334700 [Xylariaceae sp. FL0016]
MHLSPVSSLALQLVLAAHAAQSGPVKIAPRDDSCADLSTKSPGWQITNALSSDWPGSGSGRVELFAHHVPTGETADCDVEYALNATTGAVINYNPTVAHDCINFGTQALNTTIQLDMTSLQMTLRSTWMCEGDDRTRYIATGTGTLQRNVSAESCNIEPSQLGDVTSCNMPNMSIEGKLAAES